MGHQHYLKQANVSQNSSFRLGRNCDPSRHRSYKTELFPGGSVDYYPRLARKVFSLIDDLHSWEAWSGDNEGDGRVQKIFSGPASGTGAMAEWHGSGRTGAAKMIITESVVPSKVSVKVDWIKPFEAHNLNEFTIHAQGSETKVVWNIQASNLYAMKVIGIFVNMESAFGKHMESGLNNLKSVSEKLTSE